MMVNKVIRDRLSTCNGRLLVVNRLLSCVSIGIYVVIWRYEYDMKLFIEKNSVESVGWKVISLFDYFVIVIVST